MFEYRLSSLGYFLVTYCIVSSMAAGVLFARSSTDDALARTFYVTGVLVLLAVSINDLLVERGRIKSIYLSEHGFFFMFFCISVGFARELERYKRELQKSTWALEREIQRADRAMDETRKLRPMADLGKLSASLAHEIRNPLAVLSNVASTLKRHDAHKMNPDDLATLVDMMMDETVRLAKLVDDLLLFSKTGRNTRISFDVNALLDATLAEAPSLFPGLDQFEITREVDEALPNLDGSLNDLKRALLNLLSNAIQTYQEPGAVKLIARKDHAEPNTILLGVEDDAGGVDEDYLNDIFEPFFSTRRAGTGLGLSIAKRIAAAHGGTLSLENRPGQGATFWLHLPIQTIKITSD